MMMTSRAITSKMKTNTSAAESNVRLVLLGRGAAVDCCILLVDADWTEKR
jgi:hypothetical protein